MQVKRIFSDNLIELFPNNTLDFQEAYPIYEYFLFSSEDHSFVWSSGPGKIFVYSNIIFGENTNFLELEKYDIIAFIQKNVKLEFMIKRIVSKNLIIVEKPAFDKDLEFEGEYFLGKELRKNIEQSDNKDREIERNQISKMQISLNMYTNYFLEHFSNNLLEKSIGKPTII